MKKLYPAVFLTVLLIFFHGISRAENAGNISDATAFRADPDQPSKIKDIQDTNSAENPSAYDTNAWPLEVWLVTSYAPVDPAVINNEYTLSRNSYFKFLDYRTVVVKLNENFPEQKGEFVQEPLQIKIKLIKNPDCLRCAENMVISKLAVTDKEYVLDIQGFKQTFAVHSTR